MLLMCPVRTILKLAPQVGFEPTTLRLTATGAGAKGAAGRRAKGSHALREVLTGHTVTTDAALADAEPDGSEGLLWHDGV